VPINRVKLEGMVVMHYKPDNFCCPTHPQLEIEWKEKLQKEKEKIEVKKGELAIELELMLKCAGNTIRFDLLLHLNERPHCVCELVDKLKEGNSKVSYHLGLLADNNLIRNENRSGNSYYILTDYGRSIMNWLNKMPSLMN
jgi:ArsR family transcriptional regulator